MAQTARNEDSILQAVVIADSFDERFMPVTLDRPRCLLPLAGIPTIEYTFEFLAVSGVQETILYCRSHPDQIRQYLATSRWTRPNASMSVTIVVNGVECECLGDALRDIDSRGLVTGSDFILAWGDLVSNADAAAALLAHRQRTKLDRSYVLTMVVAESSPTHRSRVSSPYDETDANGVFAIDAMTSECVGWSTAVSSINSKQNDSVEFPLARLRSEVLIRNDLLDCGVDICSAALLALYTENFDWRDARQDALKGILTSDIMGVRAALYTLPPGQYAARVRSPHHYDAVSRDLLGRWVFPIVPEAGLLSSPDDFENIFINQSPNLTNSSHNGSSAPFIVLSPALHSPNSLPTGGRNSFSSAYVNFSGANFLPETPIANLKRLSEQSLPSDDEKQSTNIMPVRRQRSHSVSNRLSTGGLASGLNYAYANVLLRRGNRYFGADVVLARSAQVGEACLIGAGSVIGERTIIRRSVLGRNCVIGSDVILDGAYLWDDVVILDGCHISHALIADGCSIGTSTIISEGCIIAANVSLGGPGIRLSSGLRVAKVGEHPRSPGDRLCPPTGSQSGSQPSTDAYQLPLFPDVKRLGLHTDGFIWSFENHQTENQSSSDAPNLDDSHETSIKSHGSSQNIGAFIHAKPRYTDPVSSSEDSTDESLNNEMDSDDDIHELVGYGRRLEKFERLAHDMIRHAVHEGYQLDDALLEINGLKFSCNVSFSEVRNTIVKAMLSLVSDLVSIPNDGKTMSSAAAVEKIFLEWAPLLGRFTRGITEQIDLLDAVQDACRSSPNPALQRTFQFVVPILYKADVLEVDAILPWFAGVEASNSLFVRQVRSFVDWLQKDESSDEDSGSDEDTSLSEATKSVTIN